MGKDIASRPAVDHPAVTHHDDTVGDAGDHREIVTDEQETRPLPDSLRQDLEHLRLDGDVERGRRLVRDNEIGVSRDRRRDQRTLAQATGQLMRILQGTISGVGNADLAERLQRPIPDSACIGQNAMARNDLGNLLADRAQGIERDQSILHDEPGHGPAQLAPVGFAEAASVASLDLEPVRGGLRTVAGEIEQASRGDALARAGFTDQGNAFAGPDRQIEINNDRLATIGAGKADAQSLHLDDRRCQIYLRTYAAHASRPSNLCCR
ncbi:hypothetical protein ABIC01_007786 [Bradyrhizobium sp. RT4b]